MHWNLKQYEPKPGQAQVHVTLTVLLFNKGNMPESVIQHVNEYLTEFLLIKDY